MAFKRRRGWASVHACALYLALATVAAILMPVSLSSAQALPAEAAQALARAQRIAVEALQTYETHSPDRPLWSQALAAGEDSARLAPDAPAPQRFLAQAYGEVGWYARAWAAWQSYQDLGGRMDTAAERQLLETARWLGNRTFDGGRRDAALPYLEVVIRLDPSDIGAHTRLARYYLSLSSPLAALPHLEAVQGTDRALDEALAHARRVDAFGDDAASAYAAGVAELADNELQSALAFFEAASDGQPGFIEAWKGRAQALRQLGRLDAAAVALERVLAVDPQDAEAIVQLAELSLEDDDLAAAVTWFERAVDAYPERDDLRLERDIALERLVAEEEAAAAAAAASADAEEEAEVEAEAASVAEAQGEVESADVAADRESQLAAEQAAEEVAAAAAAAASADAEEEQDAEDGPALGQAVERTETEAPIGSPRSPLLLIDSVVEHRRIPGAASGGIAFVDAANLARDLADRTQDTLYLRVDVTSKPSDAPVTYQVCLVPFDIRIVPACSEAERLRIRGPGSYEARQSWTALSNVAGVNWERGVESVMLVLRRDSGEVVDGQDVTGRAESSAPDAYLPMIVRVRAASVPRGQEFAGWP